MTTAGLAAAVLFATACYNPGFNENTNCGPHGECPNHGHCNIHGKCAPDEPETGVDAGAGSDGAAAGPSCLGSFIKVCLEDPNAAPQSLPSTEPLHPLDTSDSPLCLPASAYTATLANAAMLTTVDACVIVVEGTMSSSVTVTGSRPLILFSKTSLILSGTLDASSHQGGAPGPGANGACPPSQAADTGPLPVEDGGGGGGGSFGAKGGTGGDSFGAAAGGIAAAASAATTLRGGCSGGNGGGGNQNGGAAGNGGGAILVLAAQSLTLSGTINASGAGGSGGGQFGDGGGGGGSGGMIVLDAPLLQVAPTGQCFANGGGGGQGGTNQQATQGHPGAESSRADSPGEGGSDASVRGAGGAGGVANMPEHQLDGGTGGAASGAVGGGGGAGGSVGVIKIFPPSQSIVDPTRISPDPS